MELHVQLFIFLSTFSWGLAMAVGGTAERTATLILIAGGLLSVLALPRAMAMRFMHLETGVAIVDAMMLLGFVFIAYRFRRTWLTWMAAFQFLTLLSHFPIVLRPIVTPEGYVVISATWSWAMTFLLIGATIATWRRDRRARTERC